MIVKIMSAGKSFKGLGAYLTHDPEAQTSDRVAWTHTLNLTNDHVPSAIDEMLWTARNAELLKQEAGIRAGGQVTKDSVKHVSLNWSPDEKPTQAHMIQTAEEFLKHMRWDERQAILVAHQDKHPHVHVMLNAVHPETGLKIDEGLERRRAAVWALQYERENNQILCANRLKDAADREVSLTRPAWLAFQDAQKSFERDEENRRNIKFDNSDELKNPKEMKSEEWKILKESQRDERVAFFADGKSLFSELRREIYRGVREEFRPQWSAYYQAKKNGADDEALKTMKSELLESQKSVLEERRDLACGELRAWRDGQYRELMDAQAEMRHALHGRQEAGLNSGNLLDLFKTGHLSQTNDVVDAFREAGRQVTENRDAGPGEHGMGDRITIGRAEPGGNLRPGSSIAGNISMGLGFGLASFFESLADGLIASNPGPRTPPPEPETKQPNLIDLVAEETRQKAARDKEIEDKRWYEERWARSRD